MSNKIDELQRIRVAYEKRKTSTPVNRYSCLDNAHLFIYYQRERIVLKTLKKNNMFPLWNKKILEVGCGTGSVLRDFMRYDANPENLFGIELLEERVKNAHHLSPNIKIDCQSAEQIPYPDKMFDIVMQFTTFTSILDPKMKSQIALEMLRVLKDEGMILWYDYLYSNPQNSDVKGIKKKEIQALFPGCEYSFIKTTLAPPLVRAVIKISWLACYFLEMIPFLRTHYVAVIRKKM